VSLILLSATLPDLPGPELIARVRDLPGGDAAPIVAEASWSGRIGFECRGTGGFGYDPLFIVAGGDRTVAEMPEAEKNRVSHRGQALTALAAGMRAVGW